MEVKNGFKITEVGIIPEDWEFRSFGDVITGFSSGATPYRGRPDFYKGNIKWITSGELNFNIITDTTEKISQDAVKRTNLKMHPVGTFLIAITGLEAAGTRGRCGIVGSPATTNQSCMALFPNREVLNNKYLYHYYTWQGDNLAFKYCQGTKQQSYTANIAKRLPIICPPLPEQQAIAEVLSDTDNLIQALEKQIVKKRLIKQGVMQKLLTPKEGWEMKTFGEIFEICGGFSATREQLSDEGYCYLHYGDIHGSERTYIDCSANYSIISKLKIELNKISKKSLLKDGDVVFVDASEDDEGTSRHVVIRNGKNIPFISGLHTIIARSKDGSLDLKFKSYCFQSKYIKDQFRFYAVGTKVSGVSKASIKNINVHLPSIIEQKKIAETLESIDLEIDKIEEITSKYKSLKQGLMQSLLTGKIRLITNETV